MAAEPTRVQGSGRTWDSTRVGAEQHENVNQSAPGSTSSSEHAVVNPSTKGTSSYARGGDQGVVNESLDDITVVVHPRRFRFPQDRKLAVLRGAFFFFCGVVGAFIVSLLTSRGSSDEPTTTNNPAIAQVETDQGAPVAAPPTTPSAPVAPVVHKLDETPAPSGQVALPKPDETAKPAAPSGQVAVVKKLEDTPAPPTGQVAQPVAPPTGQVAQPVAPPAQVAPVVKKLEDTPEVKVESAASPEAVASCRKALEGKQAKAIAASCGEALKLDNSLTVPILTWAMAEFQRGRVPIAVTWAKRVLEVDDRLADAHLIVGVAEQNANHIPAAKAAYKRYLELAPKGPYARDVRSSLSAL
jgi:hypothetical protein